jgi:hypothetical protein
MDEEDKLIDEISKIQDTQQTHSRSIHKRRRFPSVNGRQQRNKRLELLLLMGEKKLIFFFYDNWI